MKKSKNQIKKEIFRFLREIRQSPSQKKDFRVKARLKKQGTLIAGRRKGQLYARI